MFLAARTGRSSRRTALALDLSFTASEEGSEREGTRNPNLSTLRPDLRVVLPLGAWQGQRAKAVEKVLLGRALDVEALIQALEALPQDLHPTPTPGENPHSTIPAYHPHSR